MNNVLEKEIREVILESQKYNEEIIKVLKRMTTTIKNVNSEATLANRFEKALGDLLKYFNIDYEPLKEATVKVSNYYFVNCKKKISNKRIDSRFYNIITEYKLNIQSDYEKNCNQLREYIENLANNEGEKIDRYYGILTDGRLVTFISYMNGKENKSQIQVINNRTMREILKIYLSLGRKELSPKHLVKDFSIDSSESISLQLAKHFYSKLLINRGVIVQEWENLFQLGGHNDNNLNSIKIRRKVLSKYFEISEKCIDETIALFALQTTYTIILKLIAYNVLSEIYFQNPRFKLNYNELVELDDVALANIMKQIDSGDIFNQLGFSNLIEKDFFSWYLDSEIWDTTISDLLKAIMGILAEYDVGQRLFDGENVHDFFKELYQSIIPKEVRHSLGEYYTEDWLADHVITNRLSNYVANNYWRAMDPCCGSGTFIMKLIECVIAEAEDYVKEDIVQDIIKRVQGHDLNPIAVLTCKVNYFLAISRFLDSTKLINIDIPIRIGDSALVPEIELEGDIRVISYEAVVDKKIYKFILPEKVFLQDNLNKKFIEFENSLQSITDNDDSSILSNILVGNNFLNGEKKLVTIFVDACRRFLQEGHSVYWIKSILDILTTRTVGKFDFIVSNPPWIDWKALPDGYRETLKVASIDNHVFSGDRFTGGINLNICALIANVVANTWLKDGGYMGILMPKSLLFQSTYRGFRNLIQLSGEKLFFDEFVDWSYAGNPFSGVTEKFMTYYFIKENDTIKDNIPVTVMKKKRGESIDDKKYRSFDEIASKFCEEREIAYQISEINNSFTFVSAEDKDSIEKMKKIVGKCIYRGRVGLGLYPKEALLLEINNEMVLQDERLVWVNNYKNKKSERKVNKSPSIIEKNMLCPVIEGPNIGKFEINNVKYFAPFPYTKQDIKKPISIEELEEMAPHLLEYYNSIKNDIKKTEYNQRVQGKKGEFYSLTRVGEYTFAKNKVIFRNNTKWNAAVIDENNPIYKEYRMYLLLDHACSISQTREGRNITKEEAHYICAVLNSELVERYIISSSDKRSFKADIPIYIEEFNKSNSIHRELAEISLKAHANGITDKLQKRIDYLVDKLY